MKKLDRFSKEIWLNKRGKARLFFGKLCVDFKSKFTKLSAHYKDSHLSYFKPYLYVFIRLE
jgi:hypothetical protein